MTTIKFIFDNLLTENKINITELEKEIKEKGGIFEYVNNQNPVKEYYYSFNDNEKDKDSDIELNEWMNVSFITINEIVFMDETLIII